MSSFAEFSTSPSTLEAILPDRCLQSGKYAYIVQEFRAVARSSIFVISDLTLSMLPCPCSPTLVICCASSCRNIRAMAANAHPATEHSSRSSPSSSWAAAAVQARAQAVHAQPQAAATLAAPGQEASSHSGH
jgi:hypothetical protein